MLWGQAGLVAIGLLMGAGGQATPIRPPDAPMRANQVVASCDDFVRVRGQVFTGRTGATFSVGTVRNNLGGDTFGPRAIDIAGVDPALYLQQHCGH